MGSMKPLTLLLRELLWLTSRVHVSTLRRSRCVALSTGAMDAEQLVDGLELRFHDAVQPDHHGHDHTAEYDDRGRADRQHYDDLGITHGAAPGEEGRATR